MKRQREPAAGARIVTVPFRTPSDHAREAPRVARHLRGGGVILYPTETVYGLGCALDEAALERLAALKLRKEGQPFLLLAADPRTLEGLHWNRTALRLAEAFWPGPLTLVLRAEPGRFPERVTARDGTVAVRWSSHPGVEALVEALGGPITSTSANLTGAPPVTRVEDARALLTASETRDGYGGGGVGDEQDRRDGADEVWLLDGGTLPASPPSTIVDCAGDRPRILRSGGVPRESLRTVVEEIDG